MQSWFKFTLVIILLLGTTFFHSLIGQDLTADGLTYEIDYSGGAQTFTIPSGANLNGNSAIQFFAKGGDGGKRRVNSFTKGKGGGGATTEGLFIIGNGTDELKPGGRIRFVVGRRGENNNRNGVGGASGAGGSAVLYTEADDASITCTDPSTDLNDASTCWVILMAAGGGGGAYGSGFGAFNGKNGRAEECGSDGNGSRGGDGGCNGNGGKSADVLDDNGSPIRRAGGGGGALSKGQDEAEQEGGSRGGFAGGNGGNISYGSGNNTDQEGGFGYSGGGAGTVATISTTAGGGGGGGYSGGGGGDTASGGGGGSFVNAAAFTSDKRDGNSDGSPDNGRITYSFDASIAGATAVCRDIDVNLNGGSVVVPTSLIDNGSSANESFTLKFEVDGIIQNNFPVSCSEVGQNTVSLVVMTASGFISKCTSVIKVIDNTNPSISCNTTPISAEITFSQPFILDPSTILTSFSDACGTLTELYGQQEVFTCEDVGTQTVSIVAEDESGNEATCDVSVTILVGSENPAISCPSDVVIDINNVNACPAVALSGDLIPTLEGPCVFDLSYEIANSNGDVYKNGSGFMPNTSFAYETNTVTYTFGENLLNNPLSCSFTVSLSGNFRDDQPYICSDDFNRDLTAADDCEIFISANNYKTFFFTCYDDAEVIFEYTDADGQVTLEGPYDGFNPPDRSFGIGSTKVTFNMYAGSLVESCSFFVNVNDVTPPTAVCKDLTVNVGNNCKATFPASDFDNGSSEECGNYTFLRPAYTVTGNDGNTFDIPPSPFFTLTGPGQQTATVLVVDESGNESTCTSMVTLIDDTAPNAVCQDITVNLSSPYFEMSDIDGGSSDNCTADQDLDFCMAFVTSGSPTCLGFTLDCIHVGVEQFVLEVFDESNNIGSCTANVTVVDDIAPTISCSNATISLDANGEASANAFLLTSGASDNCGGTVTVTLDGGNTVDFDCSNLGDNNIVVVATDEAGNIGTCTAVVTIQDNIAPVPNCINTTIQLDGDKDHAVIEQNVLDGGTDNCGTINFVSASPSELDCDDVGGPVSINVTATDGNGNTSTCIAMITVQDIDDPEPNCKDATISLDATGEYSLEENDVLDGGFDNCGTVNFDYTTPGKLSCTDIGMTVPVTVMVYDDNGNTATCISNVTVEDNEMPVLNCKTTTVQLDANGTYTLLESDVFDGGTDNCGTPTFVSTSPSMVDCEDVGNTIDVTVTTDNGFGTIATCVASISVEDDTAPNALCQDITVQLDGDGVAIITVDDIDNGSNDVCGAVDRILGSDTFFCNQLGSNNNVTLTVTDESGNVSSCISQVTVEDVIAPTAICQDITVNIENDPAVIATDDINNGSFDNCSITSLSLDRTSFGCADVGQMIDVTLTLSDGTNVGTCVGTVSVVDNTPPIAICTGGIVTLDENGAGTLQASDLNGFTGSSDACGPLLFSFDQAGLITSLDYTCADLGQPNITLYVTDANGNTSSCITNVLIEDQLSPEMVCLSGLTIGLSESTLSASQLDGGSSDNCATDLNLQLFIGLDEVTQNFDFFGTTYTLSCDDVGVLDVTLVGDDSNSGSSFCETTVTVIDDIAPVALCQNVNVFLDDNGNASLTTDQVDNGSSDNCGGISFGLSQTSFDCEDRGNTILVTLTVTDEAGNTSSCGSNILVLDNVDPVLECTDLSVSLDGNGEVTVDFSSMVTNVTDNCGVITEIFSYIVVCTDNGPCLPQPMQTHTYNCEDIGTETIQIFAADAASQLGFCYADLTIVDDQAPTLICSDKTIALSYTPDGTAVEPAFYGDDFLIDNIIDNCPNNIIIPSSNFFQVSGCEDIGDHPLTLSVFNGGSPGTTATCDITITVIDDQAPAAQCQDVTIQLDDTGNASLSANQVDNNSFDVCGSISFALSQTSFDCTDLGAAVAVTLTVTDEYNNVNTCTAQITVEDPIAPIAQCQDITVQLDDDGNAGITANQVDNGSDDNCTITYYALSVSDFSCQDLGPNTVTLTVTDAAGNNSSCTAQVMVEDVIAPKISCQDITVGLDENGAASITVDQINGGSSDNCSVSSIDLDITDFDCGHIGDQSVTLTIIDGSGNTENCTATVTVEDNIAPTIVCQDATVELNENGEFILFNGLLEASKTDNCGFGGGSVTPFFMTCEDAGQTVTVVVKRFDNNGNSSTCNANVTVLDNIAPVPNCISLDVDLDGSPSYILQGNDVLNGGTDNCGVINFVSASPAEIFCDELGTTVDVLVTVNDGNGNMADCMAQVTVVGLPCGWSNDGGIGCTENSASYNSDGEVFTLTSENCTPAYPYSNDQMAFVSQELCGDGEIIALVTNVDGNGYGGVMMRENNDPSAPKVAISTDHVNRLLKEVRLSDGYPAWPQQVYSLDKFWLKIERKGLLFRAYASVDGVVWIPYIFQYMQMDDCIDVGLFTYSNLANTTVTSTFESVSITNSAMNTLSSVPSNIVQSQLNKSTLDVGVYPNPAINELNINLADYMDQDVSIQVYNNLGQLVINKQIEQLSDPIQQLNVSPLEAGSFLLNLRIGDQQISKRIMILND